MAGLFGWARNKGGGAIKSYLGSSIHAEGMEMMKFNLGFGKWAPKGVGRLLGPAMTLYGAYQGYKKEGAWGAVKGGAKELASSYVFGAAMKVVGGPLKYAGAAIAGAALGITAGAGLATGRPFGMWARPFVADHMRRLAQVEMGRPVIDQFGTLATMRQRSLAAIQNSKINGRSALGNEAALTYQPYFR